MRTALALLVLFTATGCAAHRTLTVTSDPPGAEVWLDEELVGVTPLEHEFFHYGTRRLTLRKEGFGTRSRQVKIKPPWYGAFPFDLVSEVLLPVGWRDDHPYHFPLVAGEDELTLPTLQSVLDRADALRTAGPDGPRELPPAVTGEGKPASEKPR